jgi:hypothetical protein
MYIMKYSQKRQLFDNNKKIEIYFKNEILE